MEALVLKDVSKRFGGLSAVDKVCLSVPAGELRAIIGPNGAGKTTLFNLICGELRCTSGSIYLFSRDITRLAPHQRVASGIGRTFQKTNVFPNLSVASNLHFALMQKSLGFGAFRALDHELFAKAHRLLAHFGLEDKAESPVRSLSYGEQRQIEVILGVALEPKLLLLDEPTAGLSPADIGIITEMIRELKKDLTIVLVEHDMDVVFDLADRITVLHYGRVIAEGEKDEVKANPAVREAYLGGEEGF